MPNRHLKDFRAKRSLKYTLIIEKTPGDGFEPPLKEPESFVLPLDDPGIKEKTPQVGLEPTARFPPSFLIITDYV